MKIIDVPQSGKCGLTVTFPSRYGLTRRAWVVPANPRTVPQLNVRSRLALSAEAFRALTEAQQDAWNSAAATVQSRSVLGQSGPLTGAQLFVKLNANLRLMGEPTVTVPNAKPAFDDLAPTGLEITNAAGVIAIKLTCPGDVGTNTLVRAAKPQSSAVRRTPELRVLTVAPAPVQGKIDLTAAYTARFGQPVAGQRLFLSVGIVEQGWQGPQTVFTGVVPAE